MRYMKKYDSSNKKRALITGIAGQDGSYLAELLLRKEYEVVGTTETGSQKQYPNLSGVIGEIKIIAGDILDKDKAIRMIKEVRPTEVYNLAGQSSVGDSWKDPLYTKKINATAVFHLVEAIREIDPKIRMFQASSAEIFGNATQVPQTELTPFAPRNPYGTSKLEAFVITGDHRALHGLHISNGILFNHESPRRRGEFVAKKIATGMRKIARGEMDLLSLGNIDAKRDWGYAPEYVEAMWLMLQQEKPDDYVIATGTAHTVREFVEAAGEVLGMSIIWEGKGVNEKGIDTNTGKTVVVIDPEFFRPTDGVLQLGDFSKAKKVLGWQARISFKELVRIMVLSDN